MTTEGESRPPRRADEVAEAAARAFRLLPAAPRDLHPPVGKRSRSPAGGSAPTATPSNGTS